MSLQKQSLVIAQVKAFHNELAGIVQGAFLVREVSPHTLDSILSFGERLSAYIMSEALIEAGVKAYFVDARALVCTNDQHTNAIVDKAVTYQNIQNAAKTGGLMVLTGFIGSTSTGDTTTLGRGGSDLTAAIFGAALGADEIEIWTDVDGVMTADPRKVKEALRIASMTYEEAMEMSHFGAKVIYPPTMMPAMEKKIPIRIKNTLNPSSEGTLIQGQADTSHHNVRGISSIDDIALLNVQGSGMVGVAGIAERLFKAFGRERINIILISQASSEHSICVAIEPDSVARAENAVNSEFALEIGAGHIDRVRSELGLSVVAVVGENMRHIPGISGRTFSALGKNGINVSAISQGSSERNISLVVRKTDVTKAVKCLHDAFFLAGTMTLNLYVVGVGLIGRELLRQIARQQDILRDQHALEMCVHGLSNTKKMLLSDKPIDFLKWKDALGASQTGADMTHFIAEMIKANRPNSVFVDCTSSEELIANYDDVLKASISIVTPNKKANSSSYSRFENLRYLAKKHGAKFIYEANVGAGLPVLSTIKNLLFSGDTIVKIEAILSGTLSFLFNELSEKKPFSVVLADAMARGYTEPDPRDDLSGMDVARKLLILGREIGLRMELSDIHVASFFPDTAKRPVNEWLAQVKNSDVYFESLRRAAQQNGKALRFVATLENGKGQAGLVEVDSDHPCFAVQGSDNVISITTERYKERPLVIKGPGAGAEVTAAQVFADIIRVSNHLN
jgi:aspartokinase/homoserine dehydrogenase 1